MNNKINIINLLINNIVTEPNIVTKLNIVIEPNKPINPKLKLNELHKKLKLNNGNFREEYQEQEMSVLYIKPHNIVLELGGNIGRNSCIIASL